MATHVRKVRLVESGVRAFRALLRRSSDGYCRLEKLITGVLLLLSVEILVLVQGQLSSFTS